MALMAVNSPAVGQLAGGYKEQKPGSPVAQECARIAVELLQKKSNVKITLEKVVKASTQVVQGQNCKLTVILGYTDCPVAGDKDAEGNPIECHVTKQQKCDVVVWSRVWLTDPEQRNQLTSSVCKAHVAK